MHDIKLVQLEL